MRLKAPVDIDTAIRIYYQYPEIGNAQIRELYGKIGNKTIQDYKNAVRERQIEEGIKVNQFHCVNTETAYKVWGIDVEDLIRRREKLKKLKLA